MLDEAIEPSPEKNAAVAAANRHLRAGNTARAGEVLKVSGIDADYIIAAVPLEQTRKDVSRAAKVLKGNPYRASEALRDAQNAVRYASVNVQAVPQQAPATSQENKPRFTIEGLWLAPGCFAAVGGFFIYCFRNGAAAFGVPSSIGKAGLRDHSFHDPI